MSTHIECSHRQQTKTKASQNPPNTHSSDLLCHVKFFLTVTKWTSLSIPIFAVLASSSTLKTASEVALDLDTSSNEEALAAETAPSVETL